MMVCFQLQSVMELCHGTGDTLNLKSEIKLKGIYRAIDNVLLAAGWVDLSQQ